MLNREKMQFPVSGLVSFKELSQTLGRKTVTTVHEFGLIKPDQYIQSQLKIDEQTDVWKVIRSRNISGEEVILDKDYFCKSMSKYCLKTYAKDQSTSILRENSVYRSAMLKKFVVEPCTEEDAKYLDLKGFDHVVVVKIMCS